MMASQLSSSAVVSEWAVYVTLSREAYRSWASWRCLYKYICLKELVCRCGITALCPRTLIRVTKHFG